jgi:glutamate--cysteine ligase
VHQHADEIDLYKEQMAEVGKKLGIGFLGIGYAPVWKLADMHPIPKKRYAVISRYMAQNSVMGIDMMYRSCTVQVNMDFSDEADMVLKMRLGLALQPITSALFASSPFVDGKPNGFITNRVNIWRYADPARSGLLPEAFEEGFGFERYVDYALDIPIYFIARDNRYLDAQGQTFRDFLNGKLNILPNERPLISDWETHLATIYPEARLKKFIEMRGADSGWTQEHLVALPALWTGLLYDGACRDSAWDLVKDWDEATREEARVQAIKKGLKGEIKSRPMLDVAKEIVQIAHEGLKKRDIKNAQGQNEEIHLEVLDDRLESGKTAADRLLDLYHGAWGGDCNKIFSVDATNLPD